MPVMVAMQACILLLFNLYVHTHYFAVLHLSTEHIVLLTRATCTPTVTSQSQDNQRQPISSAVEMHTK